MSVWLGKALRSFGYALAGLIWLARSQRNARIHLFAAIAAIAAGIVTGLDRIEWAFVVLAIGLVFAAEAFNTAVEHLSDRITTQTDDHIRRAKDVAAAAVLVSAIATAIIGALVFLPHWAAAR